MQAGKYNYSHHTFEITRDEHVNCETDSIRSICRDFRKAHGFISYSGDDVEFHSSGLITFPLLGAHADIKDKLTFDPDGIIRRTLYDDISRLFPEYSFFVGGTSSYDIVPKPYNKLYALRRYYS